MSQLPSSGLPDAGSIFTGEGPATAAALTILASRRNSARYVWVHLRLPSLRRDNRGMMCEGTKYSSYYKILTQMTNFLWRDGRHEYTTTLPYRLLYYKSSPRKPPKILPLKGVSSLHKKVPCWKRISLAHLHLLWVKMETADRRSSPWLGNATPPTNAKMGTLWRTKV